jgi:Zn-dependent M28 family amino/carboxypeptidase
MRHLLALVALIGLLGAGCRGDAGGGASDAGTTPIADRLAAAVTAEGLRPHLSALQRIATENGGTRATGTPGYDASVDYVVATLRKAGYEPRLHRFTFTDSHEISSPRLARVSPDATTYSEGEDFVPLRYSGSGDFDAVVQPVDSRSTTSGCEPVDYEGFDAGSVALVRRGGCFFAVKVGNAAAAGASAVLVFNDGSPGHEGPFEATLVRPASLPALSLAHEIGERFAAEAESGGTVRVELRTSFEVVERESANVLADLEGSRHGPPILLGGHLDSIASGPGINDNGSGVAALLEIATEAARFGHRPQQSIRFAFWAAEEVGLIGSRKYVESLGDEPRAQVDSVVNLDMLGSVNAEAFVYDADETIESALTEAVRAEGLDPIPIEITGRSDHAAFEEAGVPVGGLIAGTDEPGPNGQPHDPCYHRPCDTVENVDLATLEALTDAVVHAVFGRLLSR